MFKKILLSLALSTALVCGAEAATVTQVKSFVQPPGIGTTLGNIGEVVTNTTTTASWTTAQAIASVSLSPGVWSCVGAVATASAASNTLTAGLNSVTDTIPANTSQYFGTVVAQVSAVTTGNSVTTPPGIFTIAPGPASAAVPARVFLNASNSVASTGVEQITCVQIH